MIRPLLRSAPGTLVLAGLLAVSGTARAEGVPPQPGQYEHEGFFLRLLLGPAYLAAGTTDENGEDVFVDGVGGTFQVALGYNILPRLVLYAEVFDDVTLSPTYESDSITEELEDTTLGLFGLGLGLAYYLPQNFHVSASAVASQLVAYTEVGDTTVEESTDTGFGVNVLFGKEFWVSDKWALGLAAQLFLGSVPVDEGDDRESWGVFAAALALSATYD